MPLHRRPVPEILSRKVESDFLYGFVLLERKSISESDVLQTEICGVLKVTVSSYIEGVVA